MKKVWMVVADEAIARILQLEEGAREALPVEELTHPAAHASGADLQRDAHGQRAASATHSSSPDTAHRLRASGTVTASAGESNTHLEAESFAKEVADHLAQALRQGRFDELRIAAAPRFLGALRKALDGAVAKRVTEHIDKDLVHMDSREIVFRLHSDKVASG